MNKRGAAGWKLMENARRRDAATEQDAIKKRRVEDLVKSVKCGTLIHMIAV
jgi:hypothetical protein